MTGDVLASLRAWRASGEDAALARVVATVGSSPRAAGAAMAVRADGTVVGSLSGGCVEAAVVAAALEVCADGHALRQSFGYSDDAAFAVGLTCGGSLEVFIEKLSWPVADLADLADAIATGAPCGCASVIGGERGTTRAGAHVLVLPGDAARGELGDPELTRVVQRDLRSALATGSSASVRHYGWRGEALRDEVSVFLQPFASAPQLIVIGAMDFSAALVRQAKLLGYHTTVCDARASFATTARFPDADAVVIEWPDRFLARVGADLGPRDAICVLTHDPKFDVPAIRAALRTGVGYLGAMGSRRTVADRAARLEAAGVRPEDLLRVRMPIGLDLGARTPAETAVSIVAEMVLGASRDASARPLSAGSGPIHARAGSPPVTP